MATDKFIDEVHRRLDFLIESPLRKKPFISDWNCVHPFYKNLTNLNPPKKKFIKYNYIRAEDSLTKLISDFHFNNGESRYSMNQILTSNGSTTIISSFFIWMYSKNIKEVYYIPPIYFTFHYFAKIFGITLRPITKSHLFEQEISLNLPQKKTILIFTDPIWYCGYSIRPVWIQKICEWQRKMKSLVFVDGSFQYFKWNESKYEETSILDANKTYRLICPSKAVAMHGLRFCYLLLPEKSYNNFDFILDNLLGSSNLYDIEFALKCIVLLKSKKSNSDLIRYTQKTFNKLLKKAAISTEIIPDAGYFSFSQIKKKSNEFQSMDGKYFEQSKYKGYKRINLLSPAARLLL